MARPAVGARERRRDDVNNFGYVTFSGISKD